MKKDELPKEIDDMLKEMITFVPKKWEDDYGTAKSGLEVINKQYFQNLGRFIDDTKNLYENPLEQRVFGSHICLDAADDMKIYIAEQLNPLYLGRTLIIVFYNYKLKKFEVLSADRLNCYQIVMELPEILPEIYKRGIG